MRLCGGVGGGHSKKIETKGHPFQLMKFLFGFILSFFVILSMEL